MEKKFKKEIDSLGEIFDFITEFVRANELDDSMTFMINLAIEELFTNMVKYNVESLHDISISLNKSDNKLIMTLTDYNVEPFDITKTEDIEAAQSLEDRKIGGLGIPLVRRMVDKIHYDYGNGQSKITLIKDLGEQYV